MGNVRPDDFTELVRVSHPRVSPDGESVLHIQREPATAESYERTVYVSSLEEQTTQQFTLQKHNDTEAEWSPTGEHIAFVTDRAGRPELWIVPTAGGEGKRITSVAGDVESITWRSDGEAVAFVQEVTMHEQQEDLDVECLDDYDRDDPDPRVINRTVYRSAGGYFDKKRRHIYVAEIQTGDVTRVTSGEADYDSPEWGDGTKLYYTKRDSDENLVHEILTTDTETGETELVTTTHDWSPTLAVNDNEEVAYTYFSTECEDPGLQQTDIWVSDGTTDTEITSSLDRRVEGGPVWGPDGDYVYVVTPDKGEDVIRRIRSDGTAIEDVYTEHGNDIEDFDVASDYIAICQSGWDHPGDVFAFELGSGSVSRLTRVNEEYLEHRNIQKPTEFWVESDGAEIQGWYLTPPDFDEDATYPLVVQIHGGPPIMWTQSGTMWHEFQTMAAEGYIVVWTNPRGSTGYGQEHTMAIAKQDRPDYTDIMNATAEFVSRDYVDEENIFVTGGSFGGFMTGWIVGHTDTFTAAVAQRGVYDQFIQYGTKDFFQATEWRTGRPWKKPWEDPDAYWEASPIAYADEVSTPTLIMHSERDYRVPVHNAEMFYRFLKLNDVETELVRYPRATHELSRSGEPAQVNDRMERILEWFNRYRDSA